MSRLNPAFCPTWWGLYYRTIIVTRYPEAYIHIGNNVGISGATIYARKGITIGNNCFIGCNSIILKGAVLGDNCVVGAGAVVSGKFPANSVIVGNPARVIRTLEEK